MEALWMAGEEKKKDLSDLVLERGGGRVIRICYPSRGALMEIMLLASCCRSYQCRCPLTSELMMMDG